MARVRPKRGYQPLWIKQELYDEIVALRDGAVRTKTFSPASEYVVSGLSCSQFLRVYNNDTIALGCQNYNCPTGCGSTYRRRGRVLTFACACPVILAEEEYE